MRHLFAFALSALLLAAACGRDEPAPATGGAAPAAGAPTKTVRLKVDGMT